MNKPNDLFKSSGFPGDQDQDLQAIAVANDIDEARDQIYRSLGNHQHYDFIKVFIENHQPIIYTEPDGWVQTLVHSLSDSTKLL